MASLGSSGANYRLAGFPQEHMLIFDWLLRSNICIGTTERAGLEVLSRHVDFLSQLFSQLQHPAATLPAAPLHTPLKHKLTSFEAPADV